MFKSTFNRGFNMSFKNGLTISVQWGEGNYCGRKKAVYLSTDLRNPVVESFDAEISIWENNYSKINFGNDSVLGYCSTEEVSNWIHKTSNASSLKELQESIDFENQSDTIKS